MADHEQRLQAFVKLGNFLSEYCKYSGDPPVNLREINPLFQELDEKVAFAGHKNGWFTKENILYSFEHWGRILTEKNLTNWLSAYDLSSNGAIRVAVIMAGNIPLVGFHDFLSVLLTGNRVLCKLSSNDPVLLPFLGGFLEDINPSMADSIHFEEGQISDFDVVVATGSNNTSRYFEYYFGNKPNIIRRNRVSVGVLTGTETPEMLRALGQDIFRYYGLGCRNVSKIFVPRGYQFERFFDAIRPFEDMIGLPKYAHNYDYNKAVYLMSEFAILDNGFIILKEDEHYGSPIATLFYQYYNSKEDLKDKLKEDTGELQCVVARGLIPDEVPFGQTQLPSLTDYADGIDTVEFLLKTSQNLSRAGRNLSS